MDRLPTRVNLHRRGVQVSPISCPICCEALENLDHLLFCCDLAKDIARSICNWWGLVWNPVDSYRSWLSWFNLVQLQSSSKQVLEGVFYTSWWSIWSYRNHLLFSDSNLRKDGIFEDIVRRSFSISIVICIGIRIGVGNGDVIVLTNPTICVWLHGYISTLQITDMFGSGYTYALQITDMCGCLIADVIGSGYTFALQIANVFGFGYTSTLQIANVFGSGYTFALQIANVFGSGYTSTLQIANVFGSGYTFALQIANVFGSGYMSALQIVDVFGSALVCMHLFGLLRIETSSSTESALWDAPLYVCFLVFVYFMFSKLLMFIAAAL
ncbi:RNA-directed DNA polymerase, eukaryota [Tanacetum coccineum]